MGHKISTLVSTTIILVSFLLLVSFISADLQMDQAKQVVSEITETIQYKGYLTADQYSNALKKIPYKNVKLNITHINRDNYNDGSTTGYLQGTLDMTFTQQIQSELYTGQGIYKFKIGDEVQIDLIVMESSIYDVVSSVFTGRAANPIKLLASESGVIVNTKYE